MGRVGGFVQRLASRAGCNKTESPDLADTRPLPLVQHLML